MKKNQHVTPHPNGGWQVKGEKNKKAAVIRKTKAEAIAEGKRLAKVQKAELIIHNLDGKISKKILMEKIIFHQEDNSIEMRLVNVI